MTSCACFLTPFSWFHRPSMSSRSELHEYIHSVLERDDHGRYRHIACDLSTLNDAIQQHAERIALKIEADAKKAVDADRDAKVTLQNNIGTVSFQCFVSTPNNLDDLVQIMAKAKRENLNVKAIGGFYAFSPICETTGYAIRTNNLVGTTPTPTTSLKDPSHAEGLYDVLCGSSYTQVVAALEKDGRALMNLAGYTGLGFIGASATGTHGSGLTVPPLASMIIGINLVSGQFDAKSGLPIQYRIEPTDGITDPKQHSAPWVLIQDDVEFNATMTGLGAMGVIYSITINTLPFYWVRELREIVDWSTARGLLEQGPQGDILKYHNAEVWINAYTSQALVSRREIMTSRPAGELADKSLNMFAALIDDLPAFQTVMYHIFEGDFDPAKLFGTILALFLRLFPLLVPSVTDLALKSQNHSEPRVAKYYDIYDIGFAHDFPAISSEISFPMSSYLSAADATMSLLQKLRKQDMYKAVLSPLSIRFTASTPANLSMAYSADPLQSSGRSYMEMPTLLPFYKSIQTYDDIARPNSEQSINNFQGRLHWGQYITPSFTILQYQPRDPDFYASITSFKAVAEKFDPGHIMANSFLNKAIWLVTDI